MTKRIVNTSQRMIDRLLYDNPVHKRPRPETVKVAAIMHRCKCNDWRTDMKINKKIVGAVVVVAALGVLYARSQEKTACDTPCAPADSSVVDTAAPAVVDTAVTDQ